MVHTANALPTKRSVWNVENGALDETLNWTLHKHDDTRLLQWNGAHFQTGCSTYILRLTGHSNYALN